jgi:thioredoxin reductase (NADPH)
MFLRGFTATVCLIAPDGKHGLSREERDTLAEASIAILDGPARCTALVEEGLVVTTPSGAQTFESVYPALGSDVHNELASQFGVAVNPQTGCILVDSHQRTNVPFAYAAGDVVIGLDQISHAMGEGGVAATTIRNDLARARPLRR